jgi:hypothetical protein
MAVPPELMAALQAAGGGGGGGGGGGTGDNGLDALQDAIQALHELMTVLPDAKDTQIVSKCLAALAGIQNEMMNTRPQNAAQAVVSQLSGQQGGY